MDVTPVVTTDEFATWFASLSNAEHKAVARLVGLLEAEGVRLGFPYSSAIKGSTRYASCVRRASHCGSSMRSTQSDKGCCSWVETRPATTAFTRSWPRAEKLWTQYLAELAAGLHEED